MKVFHWFAKSFSSHGKAMFLYKRGMAKAKQHDHAGALQDYNRMIGMRNTPRDLLAMVLYNRALVYVAAGDSQSGVADLEAVLAMDASLLKVRTMARQKIARMESRTSKTAV